MPVDRLVEKPGGAHDVFMWRIETERRFNPYWRLGGKHPVMYEPQPVNVHVHVEFHSDQSAREFEAKVRAMLPEVAT
jgi:hypothetical protein